MIANRFTLSLLSLPTNRKHISLRCIAPMLLLSACALAQEGTIVRFDPPGSRTTIPLSINAGGSIT
jgi:hypothetical protein